MPQRDVEVILMRQLASCLATPILVTGAGGDLVYFNEPAEPILGRRFDETGPMSKDELFSIFKPTEDDGTPIKPDDHPLTVARKTLEPAHRRFWIQGMDGVSRQIEGTAFPLVCQSGRVLGAVGIFWEIAKS